MQVRNFKAGEKDHRDVLHDQIEAIEQHADAIAEKNADRARTAIIKDAQEALQTYHNFLLIRERIPDNNMIAASVIGAALFGGYVDTDIVGGSDNENRD